MTNHTPHKPHHHHPADPDDEPPGQMPVEPDQGPMPAPDPREPDQDGTADVPV